MATEDITKTLKAIITTLCRETSSEMDAMRRLFQLKYWLVDERPGDLEVLRDADRVFSSLAVVAILSAKMGSSDGAHEAISASTAIEGLITADVEFMQSIDRAFVKGSGFASMEVLKTISDEQKSDACKAKIKSLREFTICCLRVHAADRQAVKEDAKKLYALAASDPKSGLRKDIDSLRAARRQRLSFLFVACDANKEILEIPPTVSRMWSLLKKQSSDVEPFQIYFERCASVQGIMRRGTECTTQDIERWSGGSAADKTIEAISLKEIKEAEAHLIKMENKSAKNSR